MIIDATNMILGRLATKAAKQALQGEEVLIVNCEKAVITGRKDQIVERYVKRLHVGQVNQGPYFPKRPDTLVRRTVRGMLPRKKARGRAALGKVKCYIGAPAEIKLGEAKQIPEADVGKVNRAKNMTLSRLCRQLGYQGE